MAPFPAFREPVLAGTQHFNHSHRHLGPSRLTERLLRVQDVPEIVSRRRRNYLFLLERLESQIATGTGVPRTRKVLVDKDAVLDLIDQLRVAVPEEIHAGKRINAEGERIIE